MKLAFDCNGERWTIVCEPLRAPHTLGALAATLPLGLQLHTPKIAGNHVYWHAPFVQDPEGAIEVIQARPGAFVYWPGRQFLELIFAPLQAETASITVLGQIEGPLGRLVLLAAALREGHGRTLVEGQLSLIEGHPFPAPQRSDDLPAQLVSGRKAFWAACPSDVQAMLASRAIMHPAGPVFMAESEARVLHETLWWVRARIGAASEINLRFAAGLSCNKAATRLRDFCHLGHSSSLLFELEAAFGRAELPLAALVDEAILIAGRLAAWIDLAIPWSPINEAMRGALDAPSTAGEDL